MPSPTQWRTSPLRPPSRQTRSNISQFQIMLLTPYRNSEWIFTFINCILITFPITKCTEDCLYIIWDSCLHIFRRKQFTQDECAFHACALLAAVLAGVLNLVFHHDKLLNVFVSSKIPLKKSPPPNIDRCSVLGPLYITPNKILPELMQCAQWFQANCNLISFPHFQYR